MGGCVSTQNAPKRSRTHRRRFRKSAKSCGKISSSMGDDPYGSCMALKEPTHDSGDKEPRRKSTVIMVSLTRKFCDGEETTRFSERLLYRPRAGFQLPVCKQDQPVPGCWSEVSSSVFKLRGDNYFRDKQKCSAPDFSPYMPIGVDLCPAPKRYIT